MRYYGPNLLFFKQRTTENSLKSILFFAEGFKDEMINFKCISWGYQWGHILLYLDLYVLGDDALIS